MCKLCEINPVYEFTNKRKLCGRCFINYFQKKVLYTIRRFSMIKKGDVINYKKSNNFKDVVLKFILNLIAKKVNFEIVSANKKANKTAVASSLDEESENIIRTMISKDILELKKFLPVYKKTIKPLYLFLDEEILLYAQLKNLKFGKSKKIKDKLGYFEEELEKKHPEVKRAIVNSILELYK